MCCGDPYFASLQFIVMLACSFTESLVGLAVEWCYYGVCGDGRKGDVDCLRLIGLQLSH